MSVMRNHFFILGAMKCATTTLYNMLSQHPDICMSKGKEPIFFELTEEYEKGKDYYLDTYFSHRDTETFLGDARPRNLCFPWVPDRILSMFPSAKFVVVLRNPVDRAYSSYWTTIRSGRPNSEDRPFSRVIYENYVDLSHGKSYFKRENQSKYEKHLKSSEALKYPPHLEEGYYYKMIKPFVEKTGRDRIKVIIFDDFIERPTDTIKEVLAFLGVQEETKLDPEEKMRGFVPRSFFLQRMLAIGNNITRTLRLDNLIPQSFKDFLQKVNIKKRGKPSMDPLVELWLYQHYEPYNRRLENFLDVQLSDWFYDT